ncbi:hypothetical protein SMD44_03866 [Streptomyces alboflavus]|uniref:Uncharacterized protein n=1 Tax=Streptomyces alboflavus TaxID=67267 RepID=A0A1Z1WDG4_9ACTN|nr:hypothetical protein SMD44_03866 [Streptomyces alboflavus]
MLSHTGQAVRTAPAEAMAGAGGWERARPAFEDEARSADRGEPFGAGGAGLLLGLVRVGAGGWEKAGPAFEDEARSADSG